ncbi:MAG: energy-dependent translational throttle protein EttA [Planctomycetes bacterium]|nr:energy-dependent translational throttle protein EttA [Planctomycetota bacterium]
MSQEIVYSVRNLRKFYDRTEVLRGITLSFLRGAKIGVIGHNGSGKSSLLRIMAGVDKNFEGDLWAQEGLTIGYVPQEPHLDPTKTVMDILGEAVAPQRALLAEFERLNEKLGETLSDAEMQKTLDRLAAVQEKIDAGDLWSLDDQLDVARQALQCPPGDAKVAHLSGGERRRVAICKVLLDKPDMLLLDEPTNHLDAETVAWLEHHLAEYPGLVILVTHDRYFLDKVVGWMLEIDHGKATPYEGNYSAYLQQKGERMRVDQKIELAKKKLLERELEWIRQSPSARRKKSKARLANYDKLAAEVAEVSEDAIDLQIPMGDRLGNQVVEVKNLKKGYGSRVLIDDLSFEIPPGGVLGVIGPNGLGKTTLLKMLIGKEKQDAGEIKIGASVKICFTSQTREDLDPKKSVYDEISQGRENLPFGKKTLNARAYVARFNFKGPDQQQLVGTLSGGQRNRIQLAKMLIEGGNLLILDEPTNDLDLQTLRVLEEAIEAFPGCAIVVSHDRYFINRVATHILAFEGEGKIRFMPGDFDAYHEALEREGAETMVGRAVKYRKLFR